MAYKRRYCYLIKHDTQNDPLWADNAWILRHSLDIAAIESACDYLNGTHDFSSFRSSQCQAKSPIKTMSTPELLSHQKWLSIRFEANAFLLFFINQYLNLNIIELKKRILYISGARFPGEIDLF